MPASGSMQLVVTIDVEEEGLFSGAYDAQNAPVENVPHLSRLDPIFREWGSKPTLLVTYRVAEHKPHQELLLSLRDKWRGEIGAHLHHWNTPPLESLPYPQPVPSELMPTELLEAKTASLWEALGQMSVKPVSFRMGRFNLGPKMLSILEKSGFQVDSSICPMHRYYGGPDHLYAKTDPYFPDTADPCVSGNSSILEAPLTVLPLIPNLGRVLHRWAGQSKALAKGVSWFSMNLGSLPVQPAWTGLRRLKAAVRLHHDRGGKVLTMFFHSSELLPGASPVHRTQEDVDRFLNKLQSFFGWLHTSTNVDSVTLAELGRLYPGPEG
ncbi:MAG: hypothetical protein AB1664_22215 [Thermodesulfobacteriota bacterium]